MLSVTRPLRILALNIRHGGGSRASKIIDYLDSQECDVLVLSEFRCNSSGIKIAKHLNAQGFTVQVPEQVDKNKNTVAVASRVPFELGDFSFPNEWSCNSINLASLTIIGVYFPMKTEKAPLFDWFLNNAGLWRKTVIIGDFNTGLDALDLTGGSKFFCEAQFDQLSNTVLVDGYRSLHGNRQEFSWCSNAGNSFRIDHALLTRDLSDRISSVIYDHSTRSVVSDHSAIILELGI